MAGDLRAKNNVLVEGILTVIDTFRAGDMFVMGVSDFFGKVIFRNHIGVGGDSAGVAVVTTGTDEVEVVFSESYDTTPIVSVSMAVDSVSQEDSILAVGYNYAVVRRSVSGFVIKLNKPATQDLKFSWTAVEPK